MNASAPYFQKASAQVGLAVAAIGLILLPWPFTAIPELPFIITLGAAALIVAIKRPIIAALIFVSLSLFRIHEAYPVLYPFRLPLVFSALTVATLVWHVSLTRSVRPSWPLELKALIAFFVVVTFGIAFADSSAAAWSYWGSIFSKVALMTLVIAWLPRDDRDFEFAAGVFALSGLLVAVVAIYNRLAGIELVELTRVTVARNLDGILGDPNELALILLIPLSFALSLAARPCGAVNRALGFMAAPAILLAIVFTQSRGGLLGLLAVFAVFCWRLKSRLLVCLLLVFGALSLYQAMDISGRMSAGVAAERVDQSTLERLRAWQGALDMALDRPLTGVGLANFASSLPEYRVGKAMAAHSTWLGVLGETGLPGFIAFMVMVGATIRSGLRSHRALESGKGPEIMRAFATALVGAMAGFCVAGSFLTHGFTWPLYVIVGLTAALSRHVADQRTYLGSK